MFVSETPPFVPHLASLDDTSNFEEFEKIKHPVSLEDSRSPREFTGKDLPFVGFTFIKKESRCKKDSLLKHDIKMEKGLDIDTSVNTKQRRQSTSVDVTLTVKIAEIKKLREKCNNLEESECNLKVWLVYIHMFNALEQEQTAPRKPSNCVGIFCYSNKFWTNF